MCITDIPFRVSLRQLMIFVSSEKRSRKLTRLNSNLRIRLVMILVLSIESMWTSQMIATLSSFLNECRCIRMMISKSNSKNLLSTTLDAQWPDWIASLVITPHLRSGMVTTTLVKLRMRSILLLSGCGTIMNLISNIKKNGNRVR